MRLLRDCWNCQVSIDYDHAPDTCPGCGAANPCGDKPQAPVPSNLELKRVLRDAYHRGYQAGLKRNWPDYRPPLPPDPLLREFVEAGVILADRVHGLISLLDEHDEWTRLVSPGIARFDTAMSQLSEWLLQKSSVSEDG
jgi:hypothetical protein